MKTLKELRAALDNKDISALELTDQYLARINETEKELNAFITLTEDEARERAAHAQKEIDNGNSQPLTGIPYAAKDIFCTKGIRTTGASKILEEYIPPYNATAIEKAKDAVLLGKTNLDEFAMGTSCEHSAYGPTKNPYNLDYVAGGSSGGSAAAVSAGQVPFAFATDTGGSIRLPASFCNIVGFKPTYGRTSRYGVMAMASSLDTIGFFTNNVADSAYLLEQFAGHDPMDTTTPDVSVDEYTAAIGKEVKGMKVGIPKEYMEVEGLDSEVTRVYEESIARLKDMGAEIVDVSLPHTKYGLAAYYILVPSEVSSNLSRFDGMQYGARSENATSLDEVFTKTRSEFLGDEAKRRIMIGTFCLSSGYIDAYYKKAQRIRTLVIQDFKEAFEKVDTLFIPTVPTPPFALGERIDDPLAMYLADLFTIPTSLAGVPGIAVPAGATTSGLPVGMQFVAPHFQESRLYTIAHAFEEATDLSELSLAL